MSSQCKNSSFSAIPALTIVFGLFISGVASTVLAAPPPKKDCTQGDVYDRLVCRHEALADQLEYTSDEVFNDDTKLGKRIKPARLAHIKNAKARAQRAKEKHTKDFFKRQAKAEAQGNKKGGHLVPLRDEDDDNPSDGICDYEQGDSDAKCAAIELDESGNLQECNPKKKNKGKGKGGGNPKLEGLECDLCYDSEEASTPSEEADMADAAEQLDDTYSAMEDNLLEMNEQLDVLNANLPEEHAAVFAAENACEIPELTEGLATAAGVLRQSYATVFGIARMVADVGGQDALGFNARGITAVADGAAAVVNIAYITVDEIHKLESGEQQAAIMACVNQTAGEIAALQSQILALQVLIQQEHAEIMANDDTNTDTIMTKLEEVRVELVYLLNTPLGRRPDFPEK